MLMWTAVCKPTGGAGSADDPGGELAAADGAGTALPFLDLPLLLHCLSLTSHSLFITFICVLPLGRASFGALRRSASRVSLDSIQRDGFIARGARSRYCGVK